jgi:hypothetical protein
MPTKSLWASLFIIFFVTTMHSAQAQRSMTSAVERLFNKIESDILSSAEAMPESRYNFTPQDLQVPGSQFKGVRTFAGQVMHLATDNMLIWSAVTGDSVRSDIEDVNGPKNIKSKKEVIAYLKSSFAIGRKAIATLTDTQCDGAASIQVAETATFGLDILRPYTCKRTLRTDGPIPAYVWHHPSTNTIG